MAFTSVLSAREAEVLGLVAEGRTNAEIAQHLYISVRTVESHVSALLRKLGADDRRSLASLAATADGPDVRWASPKQPPTSFFGREAELAELAEAARRCPLVTLVGPGGTGKTRLALRFVSDKPAAFADLSVLGPGANAGVVARALAEALKLAEPAGRDVLDVVAAQLAQFPGWVVLDNCEHVLDGVTVVVERLLRGGATRLLATSRERLGSAAEHVVAVGPLDEGSAVELFLARATPQHLSGPSSERPDLAAIADVCRRLDCLPLLVELAAARLGTLSFEELAARLDQASDLLGSGTSSHRLRSVRATLSWSYDLLGPDEQALYRALSVLRGPFRLAVAEAVAPPGSPGAVAGRLSRLVDASLVLRDGQRYRQLEVVRADAAERLAGSGEAEATAGRLVQWALGEVATGALPGDAPDLLAAVDAARATDHPGLGRLAQGLASSFEAGGHWAGAQRLYEVAATVSGDPNSARAAADMAWSRLRGDDAVRLFEFAADLARARSDAGTELETLVSAAEVGTRFGASLGTRMPEQVVDGLLVRAEQCRPAAPDARRADALLTLGRAWQAWRAAVSRGLDLESDDLAQLVKLAGEADRAAVATLDPLLRSSALDCLSATSLHAGAPAEALEWLRSRADVLDRAGLSSPRAVLEERDALAMAANILCARGDLAGAIAYGGRLAELEGLRGHPQGGVEYIIPALMFLARWDELLTHAEHLGTATGGELACAEHHACVGSAFLCAGAVHGYRGDSTSAQRWYDLGGSLCEGSHRDVLLRCFKADVELHFARPEAARRLLQATPAAVDGRWRALYAATRAEAWRGTPGAARTLAEAAEHVADNPYAGALLARARGELDCAAAGFGKCGATYQLARTQLLLGGAARSSATETYRALGLIVPA